VAVTDQDELIAGRYRLIARLGVGAMGVVWQAQDERLHRPVAIKQLLLPSGLSDSEADEANRRAMREGRITARLHHPHAVAVYDVAEHAGRPCLIMEYLPSSSLSAVLSLRGVLPLDNVAKIGSQIASALAAAHQAGIVHRDIKPGNVLLADNGTAKITDFGIAHAVGDVTVTATGILAGTPAYLAPEVAQGNDAGFPSDVFSLGATLYTALEGTPPFGLSDNPIAQLHQVASGEIIPPRQSGLLTPVLLRLLHRNPDQRPTMQQAQEALATALARSEGGPPASTLLLSRDNSPFKTAPSTRRTLIQQTSPSEGRPPVTAGERPQRVAAGERPPPVAAGERPQRVGAGERPWRRGLLAGAMAIALLCGGVLAAVLIGNNVAAPPSNSSGGSSHSIPASPPQPFPPPQPAQSSPTQVSIPNVPSRPEDTQKQPQQAIADYYALMPGDLRTAWDRLTPNYQQNHAGGFSGYQTFWNSVRRVTVSDISAVSATHGDSVDATIGYFFTDGRVIEERTRFGLVEQAGQWKIDSSSVLSSQAR
jgi:eukaryotic-like serine/threonine-protein kinase